MSQACLVEHIRVSAGYICHNQFRFLDNPKDTVDNYVGAIKIIDPYGIDHIVAGILDGTIYWIEASTERHHHGNLMLLLNYS